MRRAAKRDASEKAIFTALKGMGFTVYPLNQPVDALVGFRGVSHIVEIKTGTKGYGKALNQNQQQFADQWRGSPVVVLHSEDEAIQWAQEIAKQ